MRIDSSRPNLGGPGATERLDAKRTEASPKTGHAVEPGTDRVHVSADAALLGEALKAADRAPDVRADLVDKMRQKLQDGQVGQDPDRLADRIIDHLLDS